MYLKPLHKSDSRFLLVHSLTLTLGLFLALLHTNGTVTSFIHFFLAVYFVAFFPTLLLVWMPERRRTLTPTHTLFYCLTIFFFIVTPFFYLLHSLFGLEVQAQNLFFFAFAILLLAMARLMRHPGYAASLSFNLPAALKKQSIFLFFVFFFFFIHIVNFHFYQFIPEWDSYPVIRTVEENIAQSDFTQSYRGFFSASVTLVALFSSMDPYWIFILIFIPLHLTLLLIIKELITIYRIQSPWLQSVIYLFALSVPVLSMETDMIRPQNIFLVFLPLAVYFLYLYTEKKDTLHLLLAILICTLGLNYHEFFVFPFLLLLCYLSFLALPYGVRLYRKRDYLVIGLALYSALLTLYLLFRMSPALTYTQVVAKKLFSQITHFSEWRFWFLGQYASDGATLQMGWSGLMGTLKYYAYYTGPTTAIIILLALYLIFKKKLTRDNLLLICAPLILVFFAFSEIFPRINYLYLPERFWVIIDILLVLALIPLVAKLKGSRSQKVFVAISFLAIIVGLGGSFYIAESKRSLTSPDEYKAALWIKKHTSDKAIFISQSANGPLVTYFARRDFYTPEGTFFTSNTTDEVLTEKDTQALLQKRESILDSLALTGNRYVQGDAIFDDFSQSLDAQMIDFKLNERNIKKTESYMGRPLYILYSLDKFKNAYAEREWWRVVNSYGADIEKFNQNYPLVYHKGDVYIWQVR